MSDDLIETPTDIDQIATRIAGQYLDAPISCAKLYRAIADALMAERAAKDTALSEMRAELERARAALKEIARKGRTTGYGRGALSAIAARALSQDEPADLGVGG